MILNELGYLQGDLRRWTDLAEQCYNRGCRCKGCLFFKYAKRHMYGRCKMKICVLELVRVFGKPSAIDRPSVLQDN